MTEVFRRVYRIFAHAWFSHKDVFWRVESRTGLYLLFKTVCDEYRLIPEDNYTIPPEAEGIETTPVATRAMPTILQRDLSDSESAGNSTLATGNTTKRHRHTMSHDRSVSVSTVIHEEVEEDEDGEQPTGHGPLLLTRVETARHEDGPATQQEQHHEPGQEQEQEIPAEDPPPYAEDTVVEESEKSQLKDEAAADPETNAGQGSTSESTTEEETRDEEKTSEYPSSDPPSYADIASTSSSSETPNDTASTSDTTEESTADKTLPVETESTGIPKQNTTNDTTAEHSESKTEMENHEAPAKVSSVEAEDKAAPGPAEVANADAADETEATKTVAD
jgi:hypothetical protein